MKMAMSDDDYGEVDVEDQEEDDDVEERKPIPRPGSTLCASLCSRNAHETFDKSHFLCGNLQEKLPGTPIPGTSVLCEPAQSKRTWTFEKSHFVWKLKEKCRTPIPRHTFCAGLRSRNAHRHFTRAILYGNLKEKCRTLIPAASILREPAQSKCTWTFHKSHLVWIF